MDCCCWVLTFIFQVVNEAGEVQPNAPQQLANEIIADTGHLSKQAGNDIGHSPGGNDQAKVAQVTLGNFTQLADTSKDGFAAVQQLW
jgi:hypothetical protein